jgi:hypothetical protein
LVIIKSDEALQFAILRNPAISTILVEQFAPELTGAVEVQSVGNLQVKDTESPRAIEVLRGRKHQVLLLRDRGDGKPLVQ